MSSRFRTLAIALALASLATGCAMLRPHHEENEAPADETESQDVGVHVANHNWSDIVVFAIRGSARVRLGDVTTGNEADFVLPRSMVNGGQITITLHPIGGPRDFNTGPILVQPGQMIDLRIEASINQTNWSIS